MAAEFGHVAEEGSAGDAHERAEIEPVGSGLDHWRGHVEEFMSDAEDVIHAEIEVLHDLNNFFPDGGF